MKSFFLTHFAIVSQVRVRTTLTDARIHSENSGEGTLRDRLEDLRIRLQEVIEVVIGSDRQIADAKRQGEEAAADVRESRQIIERARETLKEARRQLHTAGREALRRAQERSKKFGRESETMSKIARDARTLAEQ